jgi:glycosyltransferase involved in cell wall biosynthesis
MQEIKKRRIVLASVLKPVDDTRMFEKLGQALSQHADIAIIGYPSAASPTHPKIAFYPHKTFHRLSLGRLFSRWQIFFKMWQLKPDVAVITTHELLLQGWLLKFLRGCKLYYDIQENYYLNILHTDAFPKVLRGLIATYVRLKETVFAPIIDHFILAEQIYAKQLPFVKERAVVIENKAAGALAEARSYGAPIHFLFTGTLASTTGVFEAIRIIGLLRNVNSDITLTIAGFAPTADEFKALSAEVVGKPHIRIIGGDHLVPHQQILELIRHADVGIICYAPNSATDGRRPTKLYEYLAFRLPILACAGSDWSELITRYRGGVLYDSQNFDAADILQNLSKTEFYPIFPAEATWEKEIPALLEIFDYPNRR